MTMGPEAVMRARDRVLVLGLMPGKTHKDVTGMFDSRLFTGENRLHIIKEEETSFWYFKYENGGVPEPLKCKFTSFKAALKHAEAYYIKRNVEIKEVID